MPVELREMLTAAAATPSAAPNVEAIWRRGRQRRRRRIINSSLAVTTILAIAAIGIAVSLSGGRNEPTISTPANPSRAAHQRWITYRDTVNGFSVRIPPGWSPGSPCALLLDGGRRYSVPGCRRSGNEITYTPRSAPKTTTGPFNTVLLATNAPTGTPAGYVGCVIVPPAAIFLREALPIGSTTAPVRPQQFGLPSGTGLQTVPVLSQAAGCPAQTSLTQNVNFTDHGRAFSVGVGFATTASSQDQHETYELLNSLHFLSPTQLHSRTQTGTTCNVPSLPLPSAVPGTSVKASGTNGGGCLFKPCSSVAASAQLPTAPQYLGTTLTNAEKKAVQAGQSVRVVGVDAACYPVTQDRNPHRVNVQLLRGRVVAATIG